MGFYKGSTKRDEDITYEVVKKLGVIAKRGSYKLELRLVKWNNGEPKYDIRSWKKQDDGTEKMTKGSTFSGEEIESLYNILKGIAEEG